MLYIFDLDGTLTETYSTEVLPGVGEKITRLKEEGHDLAVATNQAGLSWRVWTRQEKFPDVERMRKRLVTVAESLPPLAQAPWYVSVHDTRVRLSLEEFESVAGEMTEAEHGLDLHASAEPGWRKPQPGMLLAACEALGVSPEEAFYVGDMETDAEAAAAAGVSFLWATEFFGFPPEEKRQAAKGA